MGTFSNLDSENNRTGESCLLGRGNRGFSGHHWGLGKTQRPPLSRADAYFVYWSRESPLPWAPPKDRPGPGPAIPTRQAPGHRSPPARPCLPHLSCPFSPLFPPVPFSLSLVKDEYLQAALKNVDTNVRVRGQRGDGKELSRVQVQMPSFHPPGQGAGLAPGGSDLPASLSRVVPCPHYLFHTYSVAGAHPET